MLGINLLMEIIPPSPQTSDPFQYVPTVNYRRTNFRIKNVSFISTIYFKL